MKHLLLYSLIAYLIGTIITRYLPKQISSTQTEEATHYEFYGAYDTFYIDSEHGAYTLTSEKCNIQILDRGSLHDCLNAFQHLSYIDYNDAFNINNKEDKYAVYDYYAAHLDTIIHQ